MTGHVRGQRLVTMVNSHLFQHLKVIQNIALIYNIPCSVEYNILNVELLVKKIAKKFKRNFNSHINNIAAFENFEIIT